MTPEELDQIINNKELKGGKIIYVDKIIFSEDVSLKNIYSFKLESDKLSQSNVDSSSNHSILFDKYEKEKNNSIKSFYSESSNNKIDYVKSDVCLGNNLLIIFSIENNVIIFSRYLGLDTKYNYYKMRIKVVLTYKELDIYKVNKVIEEISYLNSLTNYLSTKSILFSGEELFLLDEKLKINEINIKINDKLKVNICNKDNKNFFDCSKKDEHYRYLELYKEINNKNMNTNSNKIIYKKKSCQGINAIKYSIQNKTNNKKINNYASNNYIRIKINKEENNNENSDSERNKSKLNQIKNNGREDIDDDEEKEINDSWEKTDENTNQNEDIIQNNNHNNNIHSSNSSTTNNNSSTSNINNKCYKNSEKKVVVKKEPAKEELNKKKHIKNLTNEENENDILRARKNVDNNNINSKNDNTNQYSDENHNNKNEKNMNKTKNNDSYYYQNMNNYPFGFYSYGGFQNDMFYLLNSSCPFNYNPYDQGRNFNNNQCNCNNNNGNNYNNITGCNYINISK